MFMWGSAMIGPHRRSFKLTSASGTCRFLFHCGKWTYSIGFSTSVFNRGQCFAHQKIGEKLVDSRSTSMVENPSFLMNEKMCMVEHKWVFGTFSRSVYHTWCVHFSQQEYSMYDSVRASIIRYQDHSLLSSTSAGTQFSGMLWKEFLLF